jgi:hypothetical protein
VSASVLLACWNLDAEDSGGRPLTVPALFKPCAFKDYTGIPCPTCGWTRAFVHVAHLRIGAALRVQPFGALFAMLLHLAAACCVVLLVLRRSPREILARLPWRAVGLGALALFLAGWAYVVLSGHL